MATTAYVFFAKPINPDTVTALVMGCRTLIGEHDQAGNALWDHLHLEIASGGGDIIAAFAAYNSLIGLPVTISTHNAGAVDSAAIVIFLAGAARTASPLSAFFFHQLQWSFSSQGSLTNTTINDATKWLGTYEGLMAQKVADNSKLSKKDALSMMREGTSLLPEQALELGLIEGIVDSKIPSTARSWQV